MEVSLHVLFSFIALLGKSNVKDSRGQLTSILTYATGPGRLAESTKVTDPDFQSPALYSFLFGLHDGSDVGVFAIGKSRRIVQLIRDH